MKLGRRSFLAWLAGATLLGAVAFAARGELRRRLDPAFLAGGRTGRLRPAVERVLRATVFALLDESVDAGHYLEVFRWRAGHVPGALALYRRFAARMDRVARAAGHPSFAAAPLAERARWLERYRGSGGRVRLRRALFARDDERFARHVVRPVFRRFARTDAWLRAGYDAWPGMPRRLVSIAPPADAP